MKKNELYLFPPIYDEDFPIYIGKQEYKNTIEIFHTHWHEHIEFIYMTKGSLMLTVNTDKINAKEGDLLIINPNEIHNFYSESDFVEYYCIIFDPKLLLGYVPSTIDNNYLRPLMSNGMLFNNIIADINTKNRVSNIIRLYETKKNSYILRVKAELLMLVGDLVDSNDYKMVASKSDKRLENSNVIQNVIVYLHKHFDTEFSIKELARIHNISYYYLMHTFKKYTDKTIIEYITMLRIEMACQLLRNGEKSIAEVAEDVGYFDQNYFSRKFKQVMKLSPTEYIKNYR